MSNWFDQAKNRIDQQTQQAEAEQLRQQKVAQQKAQLAQQQRIQQDIQEYLKIRQLADTLAIVRKLSDVTNMLGGIINITETPTYQEGLSIGASSINYNLTDIVSFVEIIYSPQRGTAAEYMRGIGSINGGIPPRNIQVKKASWDYKPREPQSLRAITKSIHYKINLGHGSHWVIGWTLNSYALPDPLFFDNLSDISSIIVL
ncbi:MAG TPA: hypothetical protein VLG12_02830 [Candidatus Saccharimonadales bacterium]|nr:hypothetical protein [Candidatus Saccharimonadales bacterium]